MAEQKQNDQREHTYSRYVRIRDVVLKTCRRRWTIGRNVERGSGISMLVARHDDDDDSVNSVKTGTDVIVYSLVLMQHMTTCEKGLVPGNSQIIGIKSQVNKNYTIQFNLNSRQSKTPNCNSNIDSMSFFLCQKCRIKWFTWVKCFFYSN